MRPTKLNTDQGNDFIIKHMQNNIEVIDIERVEDYGFYEITIRSGKWFDRKEITHWNYNEKKGLYNGFYREPCSGKEYFIYEFNEVPMAKANDVVKKYVENWEKTSPV